jgi:hypothetical protein
LNTVTLLTKIYSANQRRHISEVVANLFEDLEVEATVSGAPTERWMQVTLSGEDETIATNLLKRDFGFCPATLENVEKGAALKGFVTNLGKSGEVLQVDIGVYQPKTVLAKIPLSDLQAKLAGGRNTTLEKIAELWGICENLPITINITDMDTEGGRVEAQLSDAQVERFMLWKDSLLDRLLVLGASLEQVKTAVEQARLSRDVVDIEALGMFEHALVCKLGTDAAGLISAMGRRLRKAKFTVFNPK